MPEDTPDYAQEIFERVLKLPTVRSDDHIELWAHYQGNHTQLIEEMGLVQKPPAWDDNFWAYTKKALMHINATKTCLRTLASAVYGGGHKRKISGTGPFAEQLSDLVATAGWRTAMRRALKEAALCDTAYLVPSYDKPRRRFTWRHLHPVTTHILTTDMDPETPIAVAEFDKRRNWVRIWTQEFYAVLARDEQDVVFLDYRDDKDEVVVKPFFPVLIVKIEEVPGSPYGMGLMGDTPRFNRALAVSWFNASFSANMKAQALLQICAENESGEVNADLTQIGPHAGLILPKGATAQFLSSGADVASLMNVMKELQHLLSWIVGIPNVKVERNASAGNSELAGAPLTTQVADVAQVMGGVEVSAIGLWAMAAHWDVGAPITPEQAEAKYSASVRLKPSLNPDSLSERTNALLTQAEKGATPEEEVVADLNPDMTYSEVQAQASVMRERFEKAKTPATKPAAPPPRKESAAA